VNWLRRPTMAWVLAGLVLLLATAAIPLSLAARQDQLQAGAAMATAVSFAAVGLVVARHRLRNPIGWLMLWLAVGFMLYADGGLYDVIGYRLGHRLPLAPSVLILYHVSQPILGLLPLVILLFPDGRLPSPWWRWVVGGYLALAVIDATVQGQMSVYALTHHRTQVAASGQLTLSNGSYSVVFGPIGFIFFGFWALAVGYQVVSWRRSSGERRQQLNWLMAGGTAALVSFIAAVFASATHGGWQVVGDVLVIVLAALPTAIGVGILKYRLYEIDRIISRTLAYTIVTGLLVGVYTGLVLLARQVLTVDSPVAVAASTLAAAALFSPLRRRVQRVVDRRFNRVRYDGERTVEAFAARLKDAVDLDMIRADLAEVVNQALEPTHVLVWTAREARPPG
jgi:hypothetical protein